MITLIETLNYRCLRHISRPLKQFHVLVGPNASGKTSFLDVISFLGQLVSEGVEAAVRDRSDNFQDLVWNRSGQDFEMAVEVSIPEERRKLLIKRDWDVIRYEVRIGLIPQTGEISILQEKALLKESQTPPVFQQRTMFPYVEDMPSSIITSKAVRGVKTVINKGLEGNDNFYDETGKGWDHSFRLGPRKSALGNLPEDESRFPASTWLKKFLTDGIQRIVLNSLLMRKASPPGQPLAFKPDGSNLPWVIANLEKNHTAKLGDWLSHLRQALPDIQGIRTVERPEDKHRYLVVQYNGGLEVPSWMVSDGTLRLFALTLPAYLPEFRGAYLIEEPENGIHPRAVETVFQSLSSVYDAQLLLATHSPVILSIASSDEVLCFAKTREGATDIVLGRDHPKLADWRGETNLGVLFAAGVLS